MMLQTKINVPRVQLMMQSRWLKRKRTNAVHPVLPGNKGALYSGGYGLSINKRQREGQRCR